MPSALAAVGTNLVPVRRRQAEPPAPDWEAQVEAVRPEVVRFLESRQLISAVKVVRGAAGLSLDQAKQVVEVIAAQEGIDPRRGTRR